MEHGAEHHAQNEPDEQPDVKFHRQAPVNEASPVQGSGLTLVGSRQSFVTVAARFASIIVTVTLY